ARLREAEAGEGGQARALDDHGAPGAEGRGRARRGRPGAYKREGRGTAARAAEAQRARHRPVRRPIRPRDRAREALMGEIVLGVDVGTTSAKVTAFDAAGETRGDAEVPYPLLEPEPGQAVQDPKTVVDAV